MSEDLMYSTEEEQEFWCNAVRGLPPLQGFSGDGFDKFGERIVWGTGSHSLSAFRNAFEIANPNFVFEIGSNMFYATAVFLEISNAVVVSCDISLKDETVEGAKLMKHRYGDRFEYFNRDEQPLPTDYKYDLAFIDGGHLKEDVTNDIQLCLKLNIPYFLFDDVLPQFGDVQEVINTFDELSLIDVWGNVEP